MAEEIEVNPMIYAEHLLIKDEPLPELHECQKEFLRRLADAELWQPANVVVSYDSEESAVVFTDTVTGTVKKHSLVDDDPAATFGDDSDK